MASMESYEAAGQHYSSSANASPIEHGRTPDDPFMDLKFRIYDHLINELDFKKLDGMDRASIRSAVEEAAGVILLNEEVALARQERSRLAAEIADEVLGLGPLEPLLHDPTITEVLVNHPNQILIERKGILHLSNKVFKDEAHIMRIVDRILAPLGRRADETSPMVDARLPDGSRVNVIIPPVAMEGACISIRKFSRDVLNSDDLVNLGTLTPEAAEFLEACVKGKINIAVSGGTGTGKTTLLNVLSSFIHRTDRVITIEDPAELQLRQPYVVRLETRPPNIEGKGQIVQRDLVRNALRMRPDRIIVGEVRSGEAFDMLQAMNTGHEGSLTTVHANAPRDALARIENMVLMANLDLPIKAIREQIASALQLIIQISRMQDGRRCVTQVTEIAGMEGEIITMQDIFKLRHVRQEDGQLEGKLMPTGLRPKLIERLEVKGIALPSDIFLVARIAA